MGRIDLYDRYINNQLSDKEREEFDSQLETDKEFASDFNVYMFAVDGIRREAHQDNMDFGFAMKHLTKEQLIEIIGRKEKPVSRDDVKYKLMSGFVFDETHRSELSGAAALHEADDDEYIEEESDRHDEKESDKANQAGSGNSLQRSVLILIFIVILLIIISIFL